MKWIMMVKNEMNHDCEEWNESWWWRMKWIMMVKNEMNYIEEIWTDPRWWSHDSVHQLSFLSIKEIIIPTHKEEKSGVTSCTITKRREGGEFIALWNCLSFTAGLNSYQRIKYMLILLNANILTFILLYAKIYTVTRSLEYSVLLYVYN